MQSYYMAPSSRVMQQDRFVCLSVCVSVDGIIRVLLADFVGDLGASKVWITVGNGVAYGLDQQLTADDGAGSCFALLDMVSYS